ncbi:MAG: (d)CMP kinase [Gemmataceae bacterium]|nr:(d)CMP kinase [Gemmataceae bacterium]
MRVLPSPIAIDGPAASGKTSVGQALARALGYSFLDTGLMYRAFTLAALRRGIPADDAQGCAQLANTMAMDVRLDDEARVLLDGEDVTPLLRGPEVEEHVSAYSAIPAVREAMVASQQALASRGPAILAGRDVGTVVLPQAPLKLFLTASAEERASRRRAQAGEWEGGHHPDESHRHVSGRDARDTTRAASPLRAADDAVVLDTTSMSLDEVVRRAIELVRCVAS